MRIRIALTVDFLRGRDEPSEPMREVQLDSLVETAGPYPIGFTAAPGRVEPDYEDRR